MTSYFIFNTCKIKYNSNLLLTFTQYNKIMSAEVTFYSSPICPFAQRDLLILYEKEIPFEYIAIDLKAKPASFTELYRKTTCADKSSDGKVPVLQHGENLLTESDLIAWYLAEGWNTGTALIPKDPLEKAKMRKFMNEIPAKLVGAFVGFMKFGSKSKEEQTKVVTNFESFMEVLQNTIVQPYAIGEEYTLADIMIYPWFERFFVLERFFGIKIDAYPRVIEWRNRIQERQSTKRAAKDTSAEMFVGFYEKLMK